MRWYLKPCNEMTRPRCSLLLADFGAPEGEGMRFVLSELGHIARHAPLQVPEVFVRNGLKYAGYRLGRSFARLSPGWRRKLSMTKGFWTPPRPEKVSTSRQSGGA